MTTSHDEFGPDFESPADPAHASMFEKPGASNAGIGRKADSPRDRDAGARSHEADASDATNAPCAEEKGGEEEIEVTEEMIEAAKGVLYGSDLIDIESRLWPTALDRIIAEALQAALMAQREVVKGSL